jgi:hypothetical protein
LAKSLYKGLWYNSLVRGQKFWRSKISGGRKFHNFRPPRFFAKSLILSCVATLSIGARISGRKFQNGISGVRNFHPQARISALSEPQKFHPQARISGVSYLQQADFELAYK